MRSCGCALGNGQVGPRLDLVRGPSVAGYGRYRTCTAAGSFVALQPVLQGSLSSAAIISQAKKAAWAATDEEAEAGGSVSAPTGPLMHCTHRGVGRAASAVSSVLAAALRPGNRLPDALRLTCAV